MCFTAIDRLVFPYTAAMQATESHAEQRAALQQQRKREHASQQKLLQQAAAKLQLTNASACETTSMHDAAKV